MRIAKNLIERRLHDVEDSSAELRAEIKRLERALKKPERLMERPYLPPTTRPVAPRLRTTPPVPPTPALAEPAPTAEATLAGQDRRIPVSNDDRFARYFSSTRFFGPPTLGRERNIQRNRAIALLLGALVLGFIVFRLIFH
ncbi:MAG: hypothetical protein EPN23_09220 [Verrucomicrobia bacterium]|nr:MAG: hypothetical protein EPN23_09220 [Verrucomicrobiota bacterium]